METRFLEDIGLTHGEAKAYLALLRLGISTVSPIAKEATVSLSKIYIILDGLIKKGLVTSIVKKDVKHYYAAEPERIIDFIEEQKKRIDLNEAFVRQKLPELKAFQGKMMPTAKVYEGINGIKAYYEGMVRELNKGDETCSMGIPKSVIERFGAWFLEWNQRRIAKGIYAKALYNYNVKPLLKERVRLKLQEIRLLPADMELPSWVNIYKNTVGIMHVVENPICVVIKDRIVYETYKKYFEVLWKQSKPLKKL